MEIKDLIILIVSCIGLIALIGLCVLALNKCNEKTELKLNLCNSQGGRLVSYNYGGVLNYFCIIGNEEYKIYEEEGSGEYFIAFDFEGGRR